MDKHNEAKPKGTIVTGLNNKIRTYGGETIEQDKETSVGVPVFVKNEEGKIVSRDTEKLTFRKAILLALATDPPGEEKDVMAKLRAGHFARVFWGEDTVELDSEDMEFLKSRINNKWGGILFTLVCEFLESGPPSAGEVVENAILQSANDGDVIPKS